MVQKMIPIILANVNAQLLYVFIFIKYNIYFLAQKCEKYLSSFIKVLVNENNEIVINTIEDVLLGFKLTVLWDNLGVDISSKLLLKKDINPSIQVVAA